MAFGIKFATRALFFDRAFVRKSMDHATFLALRRAGGMTRLIARRSIRKRKRASEPGKPPSSHSGLLKEGIWFAAGNGGKGVVVGPARLNQVDAVGGKWVAGTIPQVLEEGGRIGVLEQQILAGGRWSRVDKRFRRNDNVKRIRTVAIKARPFMAPALETVRPKLASLWKDSIR